MRKLKQKYGSYALVTGATSGIGKEFVELLAENGLNLVLVARREELLKKQVKEIQEKYKVKALAVPLDLTSDNAMNTLDIATKDLKIGLVIPNAGLELHGHFLNSKIEEQSKLVLLNTIIPMQIAHHFGAKMAKEKQGGILFVSSTFGLQSVPYFANYAATKAYILTLGQALKVEMKRNGVDVTVLAPGLTKTPMTTDMQGMNFRKMPITEMSANKVAKKGLKALLGKKSLKITGSRNVFLDVMGKYTTPRFILANMFGFLVNSAMDKKRSNHIGL